MLERGQVGLPVGWEGSGPWRAGLSSSIKRPRIKVIAGTWSRTVERHLRANVVLLSGCSVSTVHSVCEMRPPPFGERKSTVAKRRPSMSALISIQTFLLTLGSASSVASGVSTPWLKSCWACPDLPKPWAGAMVGAGGIQEQLPPLRRAVQCRGEHASEGRHSALSRLMPLGQGRCKAGGS